MRLVVDLSNWLLIAFRLLLAVRLLLFGGAGAAIGAMECLAIGATIDGRCRGEADLTVRGLGVGLSYCVPLLFQGGVPSSWWAVAAFWVATIAKGALRLQLRANCSVGLPVFRDVVTGGLYGRIRHPLALMEMLWCVFFVVIQFSLWNCAVLVVRFLAGVWCVQAEERFLLRFPAYVEYASRVRWRWVPGVF